jgi:DNA-binding HxlR family transcriptional regulator
MKLNSINSSKIETKEGCLANCLKVLGNKWTGLILTELSDGPKRFTQLEKTLKGISPRTLSQRLDDLEKFKILKKASFAEVPPRVEYSLTSKGQDFVPVLKKMADWGTKYPGI